MVTLQKLVASVFNLLPLPSLSLWIIYSFILTTNTQDKKIAPLLLKYTTTHGLNYTTNITRQIETSNNEKTNQNIAMEATYVLLTQTTQRATTTQIIYTEVITKFQHFRHHTLSTDYCLSLYRSRWQQDYALYKTNQGNHRLQNGLSILQTRPP